jgi:4-amino-4-deoxy-L-arabinose transferase-like glycosyltransferase
MPTKRPQYFTPLLALGAFLIRLAAVLLLRNPHAFHGMQAGADAVEYNRLALSLAGHLGYVLQPGHPTSFRAPGFPFFLAGVYSISYENYLLGYLAQCLLGTITVVLTYFLARQLLPVRQAQWSGIIAALYFPHIYFSTLFVSEPLFTASLALGLVLFIRHLKSGAYLALITAGLALGWATLTRPIALLLLPMLAGILLFTGARGKGLRPLLSALTFGCAFLLVIAPWSLRNYGIYNHVVLLTTNGGSTYYGGNNDTVLHDKQYLGGWISTVSLPGRPLIDATPDEASHDRVEWRLGLQWTGSHWKDLPELYVFKFIRFWLPDISSGNRKFVILDSVLSVPTLVMVLWGIGRCVGRKACWTPVWATVHLAMLSSIVGALFFWGSPRFRDADTPMLALYASMALPKSVRGGEPALPRTSRR